MKLFRKVKTITAKDGSLHFERWAIIETKWGSLYLHRIHKSDQDHMHSHPWHFISMILKGHYTERVTKYPQEPFVRWKKKVFPKIAYTNRKWFHKIEKVVKGPVWTLVAVWGGNFEGDKWHYLVGNRIIPFEEYRRLKTAAKQAHQDVETYIQLKEEQERLAKL